MTVAITALFIAAVILVNIIASLLIDEFNWEIDLTSNQVYEISDNTTDFLHSYSQNATIYVLDDEQTFKTASSMSLQAYNVIENMVDASSCLSVSFVDLDQNPDFYQKYADEDLSAGGILVVGENGREQYISSGDLFSLGSNSTYQNPEILSNVEQTIAVALEYVAGVNPIHLEFIQGHDELDISSLNDVFEKNNYVCDTINLTTATIAADTDLVVIAAPTVDYTAEEIAQLDAYLDNGGNLGKTVVYFASAEQKSLPNLEAFLAKWGIQVQQASVLETDSNYMANGPYTTYVSVSPSSPYVVNMPDADLPVLAPYCKELQQVAPQDSAVAVSEFMTTNNTCIVRPDGAGEDWNYADAEKKSYPVALAAEKTNDTASSRVLSFASIQMLAYLDAPTLGNGDLIMSSFGIAANKPSSVNVVPKTLTGAPLGISAMTSMLLTFLVMIVLPVAIAVIGIWVWTRRRNR